MFISTQLFALGGCIFAIAFLSMTSSAGAQGYGNGTVYTYAFTRPVQMYRCNMDGQMYDPAERALAPAFAAFDILSEYSGQVVIKFLPWEEKDKKKGWQSSNQKAFAVDVTRDQIKLWCIAKADAQNSSRPYYLWSRRPTVSVGVLVVPIKLRPGFGSRTTSFTTDVSLASSLDLSWRISHFVDAAVHVPLFAGIGSAQITQSESKLTEDRNVPTFSFGTGLGFSGAGAGAGFLIGCDIINENYDIKWKQQAKVWFGISIGTTFGVTKPEAPKMQN